MSNNRGLVNSESISNATDMDRKFYPDADGYLMECPRFANNGCFKSEFTEGDADIDSFRDSFHKGCSMYDLGDEEPVCRDVGTLGTACKGSYYLSDCDFC